MEVKQGEEAVQEPAQADAPVPETAPESLVAYIPNSGITRRQWLKAVGVIGVGGAVSVYLTHPFTGEAQNPSGPSWVVYAANAKFMIVGQPTRCTGCRRCELACSEYHDGKASTAIARIKVGRNYNFGPEGVQLSGYRGAGRFGNGLIIQDTCRQCKHPVPCQLACPQGAIVVDPAVNARVVDPAKCIGCRICQRACPWDMMSFDKQAKKSTKCTLCGGNPECVKACPTGALQYVPWTDRSKEIPPRQVVPAYISSPSGVEQTCVQCHGK